jgi:hypothetical protein
MECEYRTRNTEYRTPKGNAGKAGMRILNKEHRISNTEGECRKAGMRILNKEHRISNTEGECRKAGMRILNKEQGKGKNAFNT